MGWETSPLRNVVAWCDGCQKAFDVQSGSPTEAADGGLTAGFRIGPRCPACGGSLALRRRVRDDHEPTRATLLDPAPMGIAAPLALQDARMTQLGPPRAGSSSAPAPAATPVDGIGAVEAARIGPYRIVRELGRGGMGIVYLAEDPALGRQIALKVLPYTPLTAGDPEYAARFEREARATAQLSHPNLVAVHAVGETPGCRYIAMEFVAGCSLEDLFQREGMSPERAVRLVWQAALGLAHAHQQGVVHRDIKPANIMVESVPYSGSEMRLSRRERVALEQAARRQRAGIAPAGTGKPGRGGAGGASLLEDVARVTDFGLAVSQQSQRLTVEGAILGTPVYMSPEQTLGRSGEATPQTDVYGLGATLYELITGGPPFQSPEIAALFVMIQDLEPTPPRRLNPRIDRDLQIVVLKCLDKEPSRRYPDAGALADDLRRWLDDEPVLARRPSRIEIWKRRVRRNPRQFLFGALAGFLLLGVAGYGIGLQAYRIWRFDEALAQAEQALARDDLDHALQHRDHAAGWLRDRVEIRELGQRIERRQILARTVNLGRQRLEAWTEARKAARALAAERTRRAAELAANASVRARQPLWKLEADLAEALTRERAEREAAASNLTAALQLDPGNPAARTLLIDLCTTLLEEAEAAGDASGIKHWEVRLREVAGKAAEEILGRKGTIRIAADPEGAAVSALLYREIGILLVPCADGRVGPAPAEVAARFEADPQGKSLPPLAERAQRSAFLDARGGARSVGRAPVDALEPPGTYLLLVEQEGRVSARVPVKLPRGGVCEVHVRLPETVPAGFAFVSGGPYPAGDPLRPVEVADFCMAVFETTNGEWRGFLNDPETLAEVEGADGIRRVPRTKPREGALWSRGEDGRFALPAGEREDAPVTGVDLDDARAYARWYDRRRADARWAFDLPTESEWEKAARGTDGRVFPWGNRFDRALCSVKGSSPGRPAPVGAFPADESPYGVRDLAGNAAEWTVTGDDATEYAVKGGSWTSDETYARAFSRDLDRPGEIDDENGVRLVARMRK